MAVDGKPYAQRYQLRNIISLAVDRLQVSSLARNRTDPELFSCVFCAAAETDEPSSTRVAGRRGDAA
jgi:hypothetical protein